MTTLCSKCGSSLAADVRFCPQCGTPTSSYSSNFGASPYVPTAASFRSGAPLHKPATDYGSPPYGVPQQNPYEPLNPYEVPLRPPPPPRQVKIGLLIGVVGLVLLLGGVGIFTLFTRIAGNTSQGNTSVTPNACGGAFSDEFKGSLHSGWSWIDPGGNSTYDLTAQGLRISDSTNNDDLYPSYTNANAPRLLQPISGNFTVDTLVEFNPIYFYQGAGILIWQDDSNFLRFERAFWGNRSGIFFAKRVNGGGLPDISPLVEHPTTASVVELRLQKNGDHFTSSWREPGKNWQIDGETDFHFDYMMVGLDLVAVAAAPGATPPTTAYYSYFRVSSCT
jgi:regulation of enolase protein 1 (concanavalin A-like superfamily)